MGEPEGHPLHVRLHPTVRPAPVELPEQQAEGDHILGAMLALARKRGLATRLLNIELSAPMGTGRRVESAPLTVEAPARTAMERYTTWEYLGVRNADLGRLDHVRRPHGPEGRAGSS